jgi:hypothetical protein
MSNIMNEAQMAYNPEEKLVKPESTVDESNQGMVASASEGERRVRTGPDGNPTGELTDSEYKQYLESYNN